MLRHVLKTVICILLLFVMGNTTAFSQSNTKQSTSVQKLLPRITIALYDSGNIPLKAIKGLTQIGINKPYKLVQFTIVFNSTKPGAPPLSYYTLKSENLDKTVLHKLETLEEGYTIILDEIRVADEEGNIIKIKPAVFHVVADNEDL